MYGDFAECYDFAVHCFFMISCTAGRGKPLPYGAYGRIMQKVSFATAPLFALGRVPQRLAELYRGLEPAGGIFK